MGAKVGGDVLKGYGKQQGAEFEAARSQRAAEIGRLRADQLDTQMREELHTTLGNIDTIRAASNIDYLSPTTAAIKDNETRIADRERGIKVNNLLNQSKEDDLTAGYQKWAGKMGMVGGVFDAFGDVGKYAAGLGKP